MYHDYIFQSYFNRPYFGGLMRRFGWEEEEEEPVAEYIPHKGGPRVPLDDDYIQRMLRLKVLERKLQETLDDLKRYKTVRPMFDPKQTEMRNERDRVLVATFHPSDRVPLYGSRFSRMLQAEKRKRRVSEAEKKRRKRAWYWIVLALLKFLIP